MPSLRAIYRNRPAGGSADPRAQLPGYQDLKPEAGLRTRGTAKWRDPRDHAATREVAPRSLMRVQLGDCGCRLFQPVEIAGAGRQFDDY
jgi:hypothetical protein